MLQNVYSQTQSDDVLFGRVDKGNTNYVLKNLIDIETSSAYYLCGPEAMIQTVKEVLIEKGIDESKILFELLQRYPRHQMMQIMKKLLLIMVKLKPLFLLMMKLRFLP